VSILPPTIRAVSLDFANTLYPLRPRELDVTIMRLHQYLQSHLDSRLDYACFRKTYLDVREGQFSKNRATLRENDFTERIRHVVAAVMGEPAPARIVAAAEDAYVSGFIDTMEPPQGMRSIIQELSRRFEGRVAVCSNFLRADAIRIPLDRDGISGELSGIVVSCEIGFIKPHPLVFEAVTRVLDVEPSEIVHIGDDWEADIIGGTRAGMRTIYTRQWRNEPDAAYGIEATPLCQIDLLEELLSI